VYVNDWDARGRKLEVVAFWAKTSLVPLKTAAARAVLMNMICESKLRMVLGDYIGLGCWNTTGGEEVGTKLQRTLPNLRINSAHILRIKCS
jgi:hypothetical protein